MLQPLLMPLSEPTPKRKQVNPDLLHCGPKKEKRSTFHFWGLTITILRSGGVIFWLRLIHIPTQQSTPSSDGAWNWSNMASQLQDQLCGIWAQGTAQGPHEWQRLWCLEIFILVGGQWRGPLALLEPGCWDSTLIPLPSSSSALCPFWKPHTQSTFNIALMSFPGPLGGPSPPPPASPWGQLPFHFLGGHCPGLFSPGCDLGDPALDSCSQLFGA